ncbi:hypothetical protein [Shinella sp. M27]|uniref:hypothetical protein n=1 Tax=Shinella sp. M27 TaxID=3368614 RepID=UPI003BA34B0B
MDMPLRGDEILDNRPAVFGGRDIAGVSLLQSKQDNYSVLDGDKLASNGDNA